jgi:hypothetical protein
MPPDDLDDPDTIAGLMALNFRALLASRRITEPQGVAGRGVTDGAGNQGSSAFVFLGQSGTASNQTSIPRNLRFGNTASAIPLIALSIALSKTLAQGLSLAGMT